MKENTDQLIPESLYYLNNLKIIEIEQLLNRMIIYDSQLLKWNIVQEVFFDCLLEIKHLWNICYGSGTFLTFLPPSLVSLEELFVMCIIIPPSLEEENQGLERLSDSLKVIQLVDPRLEHGFAGLLGPCSPLPITLHRAVLDVPLRQCQTPARANCGVALLCLLQSCGRRSAMGRYYPKALEVSTHPGATVKRQE